MKIDGVWVQGRQRNNKVLVREQRLNLANSIKDTKEPPSLKEGFGLIVGFNPPSFYLHINTFPRAACRWTLAEPKATHMRMRYRLKHVRDVIAVTGCKLGFVNVISIVNIYSLSGEFAFDFPKLEKLRPERVLARFEKYLPQERPRWIWCAWSKRVPSTIRSGTIDILSRQYPGVFNFGLYHSDDVLDQNELHINEADSTFSSGQVWY